MAPRKPSSSQPWFILWFLSLWAGIQTVVSAAIGTPGRLVRLLWQGGRGAIDSGLRPYLDSFRQTRQRQKERRRRWWRKNGPLKPIDQLLGLWGIRPVQWRRWFKRSSLFLFTCCFTLIFTGILGWFLLPARAADVTLAIEPITWDFVGLDSNKPETQGPDTYVVGARVCNLSETDDAINVTTQFFKDGVDNGYTFIRLTGGDTYFFDRIPANTGTGSTNDLNYNFDNPDLNLGAITTGEINSSTARKTKYTIDYTPINCQDFYYNFKTSRTPAAWQTYQKYYIEADAANATASVTTPRPRQIYIEQLISQARNTVYNFGCKGTFTTDEDVPANVSVAVGEVFTCTAQAQTATAYPQLSFTSDIPNVIFQILDVQTSYSNPATAVNSTVYADGCGWVQDPTDPRYHRSPSACVGETGGNGDIYQDQYPYPSTKGAVGNLVTTNYTIKVLELPINTVDLGGNPITSNTIQVSNVILDYSGSSYHYNADYGQGLNRINITVGLPDPTDLQVTKTHGGNFSYGPNSYTIGVTNSTIYPAKAPVKITDTLPTGYTFTGLSGTDASKWSCGVSGQVVTCTYTNGTPNDPADDDFPGTSPTPALATNTLTFGVNVAATVPNGSTSTNVVTVSASNDNNSANNTATDPTTVLSGANLQLTKSDSDATFVVGDLGSYTLTVTNLGDLVATGPIKIIDTLPAGLTYSSASSSDPWSCVNSGQVVDCTLNQNLAVSPAVGSASSLTITVNVGSSAVPSVTNTASANSSTYDPNPSNNTNIQEPTPVTPKIPDLSISKTHEGSFARYNPPNATANSRYTITVTNVGAAATTGPITVTDTLPAALSMSYQSHASTTDWSCTNSTPATCAAGNTGTLTFTSTVPLLPGQSRTLTLDVQATTAGTANNTATVTTTGDGTTGTKSANDSTTVGDGSVDLAVSKTVATAPTGPGTPISYSILVTNNSSGNGQDSGITLTDVVPSNITVTNWSCTWDVDGPANTTVGDANDLGNGGNNVYNSCTGTGTTADDSAHNIPNTSPASNTVSLSTISLRKAGGQVLVTINGTVNSGFLGTLSNTARVTPSSGIDATPIDNISTVTSAVNSPNLDLEVTKTDADDPMTLGVTSSYTMTVTNRGSIATVNPITLVDSLPSNFTFVSGASTGGSSGWVCANTDNTATTTVTEITCVNNTILAAGASTSVRINVTPTTTTGSPVTNSATVSTPGEGGTTYPNTATQTTAILAPNVNLGIVKTAANTPFNISHEETYTLTVNNSGTTAAIAPVTITDTLPPGMQFLYGTSSDGFTCTASGQTVTCNRYSNLAASGSASVTLRVLVGPTTNTTQNVTCDSDGTPGGATGSFATCNTATVASASTDTNTANNTAEIGVNINPASDLAITKATVGTFVPGETGTYTLQVTNNGPSAYTGSIVIDDAYTSGGANVTFNSATTNTGTLTCPTAGSAPPFSCTLNGGLTAGQIATITLKVNVNVTSVSGTSLANTATINNASLTSAGDPSDEDGDGTVDVTQGGSDPETNDRASASVTIASNTANLVLSKDDGDGESPDEPATATLQTNFVRGGTGTYILLVTNNGPAAATAPVKITEDPALPNELTYAGYSPTGNWRCVLGTSTDIPEFSDPKKFTCTYGSWNFGGDTNADGNPIGDGDDVFTQTAMPAGTTSGVEIQVNVPSNATLGSAVNTAIVTSGNNATGATGTETTVIKDPADLRVTKTAATLTAGNPSTYTITVTNNGPGASDPDIYLTDYLPTGVTYAGSFSATGTGTWTTSAQAGDQDVTLILSSTNNASGLGSGDSSTITLNVTVAADAPATVRNFVRVEGFTEEVDNPSTAVCDRDFITQPVNNCFAVSTPVTNGISPTIVKKHPSTDTTGAIDPVDITTNGFNTQIPYTIEVANPTSPAADIPSVLVYDTLPETLTYVSASVSPNTVTNPFGPSTGTLPRPCSYDAPTRTVSCNLITLKASETATVTLTVTPNVTGIIPNTATLSTGPADSESVEIINGPSTSTISGTVFADNNSNGAYNNPGDTPTGNITVNLYRDNNGNGTLDANDPLLSSTATTGTGSYSFSINLTGNFIVAVDQTDPDLLAIDPTPTFTTATALAATPGTSGKDFGYAGTAAATPGNVVFVKRITAVNTTPITGFVDDATANDNDPDWPGDDATYLRGAIDISGPGSGVEPGDELEYTIYFLSNGGSAVRDVQFCDLIPANTTYVAGSTIFGYDTTGTTLPDPSANTATPGLLQSLTDIADGDVGRFYTSAEALPPICTATGANNSGTNTDGAVFVQIEDANAALPDMPFATGAGTPADAYGFVRFRVTVD